MNFDDNYIYLDSYNTQVDKGSINFTPGRADDFELRDILMMEFISFFVLE